MTDTSKVQTEPGTTVAPQQTETLDGKSSVKLLALAGDENARRALGAPTTSQLSPARVAPNGTDGFKAGNTATQDVYESTDGKLVKVDAGKTPSAGKDGFRGTLLVAAGDVVTGAVAGRIAQG